LHSKQIFDTFLSRSNDPVYLNLHSWLKGFGFSSSPPLKPAVFPETGRGLQASRTIEEGDVVVTIPVEALITRELALRTSSLKDLCNMSTQTILAAWLLHESSKGSCSSYQAYLLSIPLTYTTPYFCTPVEQALLPSYLLAPVTAQQLTIKTNYTSLVSRGLKTSLASFEWAWFTVNTRAVYLSRDQSIGKHQGSYRGESGDSLALAPYLDLLNHSVDVAMKAGVDIHKDTSGYQIVTKTKIKKYKQAFINYGPHDNTRLLLEYGFFVPNNPHECFNLSLNDVTVFIESEKDIVDKFSKVDILTSNKLDQKLCVTREGLSWNLVVCLKILCMEKDELKAWHLVFQDVEGDESDQIKKVMKQFISYLDTMLASTVISMGKTSEVNCSASFSYCFDLVKSHARILQEALLSM